MNTVFFNADVSDDHRREQLYQGQLFVNAPSPASQALCALARTMCEEAFAPHHPQEAQHHLPVEEYIEILKELKPKFIHDPRCKELIPKLLAEQGCDLDRTYFDVPRLRTSTAHGYLTSGMAYAFKPHRDTWYSSPMCQLNWWLPVYEFDSNNGMAFYSQYWDRPIKNSSDDFNYQDWNANGRKQATQQGKTDTRRQSEALELLELTPELRLVTEPGGLVIFSAAQLHGSVPNTSQRTRISIDFRTVHLDELETDLGAPNIDSHCTGTTIGDYLRGNDQQPIPAEVLTDFEESTCPSDPPAVVSGTTA
jgi:hypothetical protein